MRITDEAMKEYKKRSATIDIPRPITTGTFEMTKDEKKKAKEDLERLIEEMGKKQDN